MSARHRFNKYQPADLLKDSKVKYLGNIPTPYYRLIALWCRSMRFAMQGHASPDANSSCVLWINDIADDLLNNNPAAFKRDPFLIEAGVGDQHRIGLKKFPQFPLLPGKYYKMVYRWCNKIHEVVELHGDDKLKQNFVWWVSRIADDLYDFNPDTFNRKLFLTSLGFSGAVVDFAPEAKHLVIPKSIYSETPVAAPKLEYMTIVAYLPENIAHLYKPQTSIFSNKKQLLALPLVAKYQNKAFKCFSLTEPKDGRVGLVAEYNQTTSSESWWQVAWLAPAEEAMKLDFPRFIEPIYQDQVPQDAVRGKIQPIPLQGSQDMPKGERLTDEDKLARVKAVQKFIDEGNDTKKAAELAGFSSSQYYGWRKDLGINKRNGGDVTTMTAGAAPSRSIPRNEMTLERALEQNSKLKKLLLRTYSAGDLLDMLL